MEVNKNKDSCPVEMISRGQESEKVAATYSPTWWGSTIGDGGLNFSVRNGKRWDPAAITATVYHLREITKTKRQSRAFSLCLKGFSTTCILHMHASWAIGLRVHRTEEGVGLLVRVGFGIAAFTPPAYRRGSLPRPSKEVSSWRRLRA